tara:strand:- start:5643 stop:6674 length:1032 start_codon:yes stop_codon:yes gene_type:complete
MEKRSKFALKADKNLKAMGAGERTSKKVSTIRKADGSSFKRRNANQYYNDVDGIKGDRSLIGEREYTEKRLNRTDKFNTGGTADSAENGGANIGGTLGSSMMRRGGVAQYKVGDLVRFKLNDPDVMSGEMSELGYENGDIVSAKIVYLKKEGNGLNVDVRTSKGITWNIDSSEFIEEKEKGGKLIGKQKNLDLNKNGKLDSNDFKMLRGKKGNGGGTGVSSQTGFAEGTNADLLMNKDYLAYANGGGLANVPESFPETDAMSYKKGGTSDSDFERDYKKVKQHIKEGYGNIDSGYVETTWENMSNITYSAIEDKLIKRLKKDGLFNYANGGSIKGFEYSIGGL